MTDSELAVARLVAGGLSNREVAERLFVSPHTVNSHLRHVFGKLDVNSRVELTRLADVHESRGLRRLHTHQIHHEMITVLPEIRVFDRKRT